LVSIRQHIPCSIRAIVIGEMLACRDSSDLLINKDSRICLSLFFAMFDLPFASVAIEIRF